MYLNFCRLCCWSGQGWDDVVYVLGYQFEVVIEVFDDCCVGIDLVVVIDVVEVVDFVDCCLVDMVVDDIVQVVFVGVVDG